MVRDYARYPASSTLDVGTDRSRFAETQVQGDLVTRFQARHRLWRKTDFQGHAFGHDTTTPVVVSASVTVADMICMPIMFLYMPKNC